MGGGENLSGFAAVKERVTPVTAERTYGTLRLKGGRWEVAAEPHVIQTAKRLWRRRGGVTGRIFLDATPATAVDLAWFIQRYPLALTPADREELHGTAQRHEESLARVRDLIGNHVAPPSFALAVPPRAYQAREAAVVLEQGHLLVADEVGLGKSCSAIAVMAEQRALPAVVVTLTHLPEQWAAEVKKFAPGLRVHVVRNGPLYALDGSRAERERGQLALASSTPDVVITSYSKLAKWAQVLREFARYVVFDEVQELRRTGSLKYEAARALAHAPGVAYRMGCSATPIYNYGDEVYSVLDVLAPGSLGSWTEFSSEWCVPIGNNRHKLRQPAAFGTWARDQGLMVRHTRREVGRELPDVIVSVQEVGAEARRLEEIQGRAAELARILVDTAARQKGEKLMAGGELDRIVRQATGLAKGPYVAEFVRLLVESGERVLLAGWHHACFARGTPVLMGDGVTRPVENVGVGDYLCGPQGERRTVKRVVRGRGPLYRVVPNKGESFVCNGPHRLALCAAERVGKPTVTVSVDEYLALTPRRQRGLLLFRSPCAEFGGQRPSVFNPWLLGLWLGDGAANLKNGFRLAVADSDGEIMAELRRVASGLGLAVRVYKSKTAKCSLVGLTTGARGRQPNLLVARFKSLNLHDNKHIPYEYKTADEQSRLELVAGFIDADGHMGYGNSTGSAVISQRSERLAGDLAFVCRSLGFAAYVSPTPPLSSGYSRTPRIAHRVNISGDMERIPTRLPRKQSAGRAGQKSVLRTGFRVEALGDGEYFGFTLAEDPLFLLGDFTVVHNCYDLWAERLAPLRVGRFTGQETPMQKRQTAESFVRGELDVLMISLRAGAGLDGLQQAARVVVFGELDWSPGVHEQVIGRLHRDGQPDPVVAYYLVADSGSDPVVAQVLGVKRQQAFGVVDPTGREEKLFAGAQEDRARQLAEAWLERAGR